MLQIFQAKAAQRLISMKRFPGEKGKKYILSGEFRLTGAQNVQPFYFGFLPADAKGRRINAENVRQVNRTELAEVADAAAAGATEITLKKAPTWPTGASRYWAAFNAAADGSDLPNFDIVRLKSVRHDGDKTVITLASPLRGNVKAGSKVRLQTAGASFLYTGCSGKKLTGEWQKFSGTIQFDAGAVRWYPGTTQAAVVILPAAKEGTLEFRNITVSAETGELASIRISSVASFM